MNNAAKIKKLIQNIAGVKDSFLFVAEVIDVKDNVCEIKVGELTLTGVRLRAITPTKNDTLLVTPQKHSMVLVADLSGGEMCDLAVIQYSEVKEIFIKVGEKGTEFKIDESGYAISKDGESLKDILLDFIDVVMRIFVVQGTGPDLNALKDLIIKVEKVLK